MRALDDHSLTEAIDSTTFGGKLILHMFAALAEFERAVIRERTLAGFDQAITVHLRRALATSSTPLRSCARKKSGSIINIVAVAGHWADYSSFVFYGIAKTAMIHLTRCAAMGFGEHGVRIEILCLDGWHLRHGHSHGSARADLGPPLCRGHSRRLRSEASLPRSRSSD